MDGVHFVERASGLEGASQAAAEAGCEILVRMDIDFLNHGSLGAYPRPVFEAYQRRDTLA
jgi:hypothetical protein